MTRISDWLIDPADGAERNVEKLLVIADALMRQVEQASGDRGAAYEQFQRAALLEERVRQRTRDLEQTLRLLSDANARLSEASRDAERARRDLAEAIEAVEEGFALFDAAETLVMCNSRFCRGLGTCATGCGRAWASPTSWRRSAARSSSRSPARPPRAGRRRGCCATRRGRSSTSA